MPRTTSPFPVRLTAGITALLWLAGCGEIQGLNAEDATVDAIADAADGSLQDEQPGDDGAPDTDTWATDAASDAPDMQDAATEDTPDMDAQSDGDALAGGEVQCPPDPNPAPVTCTADCDDKNGCTLDRCVAGSCVSSAAAIQEAYVKASDAVADAKFGGAVAVQGNTLVIGAAGKNAAHVFVKGASGWAQEAVLQPADVTITGFGSAVAVYGNIAAIGTTAETVCIFARVNAVWSQQTCVKAPSPDAGDHFGTALALSGSTLVIGAHGESSSATGIDGNPADNSKTASGAVYVFVPSVSTWTQQSYLKAPVAEAGMHFGYAVAIDGDTIVIGAVGDASAASGVNGAPGGTSKPQSGAAFVFTRLGATWAQQAYLKASNPDVNDLFGQAVAIAGDTVLIGAPGEASAAIGMGGNQADNTAPGRGAGYIFSRTAGAWAQTLYLKAKSASGFAFGASVAVAGKDLAIGAPKESSGAVGVGGEANDYSKAQSGAGYVYRLAGGMWSELAYVKASNTAAGDLFGSAIALAGGTLVIGASGQAACASGVNPGKTGAVAAQSGAAYAFATDPGCDDGDPCTIDACLPAAGCTHTLASGCTPTCGDGLCSGEETALTCTVDCGFLLNRYAGTCPTPNSWADCPDGYVCVARNAVAGGNICVADFENWQPIPDSHPASDFSEFADYVVDNKTNLFWQKKSMNWTSPLPPCVTETAGGFNDWRLPTEGELLSLVDYNAHTPATSAPGLLLPAPATPAVILQLFASATPVVDPLYSKKWHWGVDLNWDGGAGGAWFTMPSDHIRCVRSVAAPVAGSGGRFAVENSGQTFLDRMSGLHWQRGQGKVATWQTAKDWCNGNLGGLPGSGWRLPTEGEFRQLANRQGNAQWLTIFAIAPAQYWWTWGGWTSAVKWSFKNTPGGNHAWEYGVQAWVFNTWPTQQNFTSDLDTNLVATCVRQ